MSDKQERISLVELSRGLERDINTLEDLKEVIKELPTDELVGSYEDINDTKKTINDFRSAIRDEIVDSRIYEESDYITEDEEGNIYLTANERVIKAVRRVKKKLKEDKAKDLLMKKNIYENGVERKLKGDAKAMDILMDIKDKIKSEELKDRLDTVIYDLLEVEENVSEKRLKNLKDLGFIDEKEYDRIFDEDVNYALYPITSRKEKRKINS